MRRRTAGRSKTARTRPISQTNARYHRVSTVTQISASSVSVAGASAPAGTNCGRNETANTAALGLARMVPNPSRYERRHPVAARSSTGSAAPAASPARRACRSDCTPITTSVTAPQTRITS